MMRIMVVDDEPLTRQYLKTNIPLINSEWLVAAEAMDGCEALDVLADHAVDLVITDIKMPVMDGLALCEQLAAHSPDTKIVILSGYDEFSLAKQAIRYGVNEYLLKPIVRDELKSTLKRIAELVEKERQSTMAHKAMLHLSEDSKKQVVRNFIKAVITESNAEIQELYPMLFRMKVSLIESEALIMILVLDDETLLEKSVSRSDVSLFRYILHQVASEIMDNADSGHVSFDNNENTVVLMCGDDETSMIARCHEIFHQVAEVLQTTSQLSITAATGVCIDDILQLHISYQKARQMLGCRLAGGGGFLYDYREQSPLLKQSLVTDNAISSILSGVLDNNEMLYALGVKSYVEVMDDERLDTGRIIRYGVNLIRSLEPLRGEGTAAAVEEALKRLRAYRTMKEHEEHDKDKIRELFSDIARLFIRIAADDEQDEKEIVIRAKDYIYRHYAEPISLGLIAEKIGVTANYLSSLFHKSANESYIKFLTRVRMEQAAKLLTSGLDEKIYDISEKVGYVSVKHFSHVFKQHFHMPPGEFQEKQRKK